MKSFKKALVALVAAMVMVMGLSVVSFAANSPVKTSISSATATAKSVNYNGKKQSPAITVKAADGTVLKEGVDYTVETIKVKDSGDYTVVITGIGRYEGTTTATFTIKATEKKSANKIAAAAKKSTFKASSMKKKDTKVKLSVKTSKKKNGAVTYKVVTKGNKNAAKYVKVNKKGVVTFKKGIKKGTYKIKVMVAGKKGFAPQTKTLTFKVK